MTLHLVTGLKVQFLSWLNQPVLPTATCILLKFHLLAYSTTTKMSGLPQHDQRQLICSNDIIHIHPVFQDTVEEISRRNEIHLSLGLLTSPASPSTNALGIPAEGAPTRSCPPPRPAVSGPVPAPPVFPGRGGSRSPPPRPRRRLRQALDCA